MEIFLDALLDALIGGVKNAAFFVSGISADQMAGAPPRRKNIESALAGGGRWGFFARRALLCAPVWFQRGRGIQLLRRRVITPAHCWPYLSPPATRPFRCWPLSRASGPHADRLQDHFAIVGGVLDFPLRKVLPPLAVRRV